MAVNHKRVLRMMREDNLLSVPPNALVFTTDSEHESEVYLNLARRMKRTAVNQLWVADITYIRLRQEFVYLALVLDAFSLKSSAGRWIARSPPACRCWPWGAPSPCANPRPAWCTTPIAASSTLPNRTCACSRTTACCPA